VTAVVLTPSGVTPGLVTVSVTGAPAGDVTITRVDANGATPVRRRTGVLPVGGALNVQDYEPALVGNVRYDVVDSAAVTTSASIDLTGSVIGPRIHQVQLPAFAAAPSAIVGYTSSVKSSTVVHWPIDRTDPIAILRKARTREGQLTAYASSYANADAMLDTVGPGTYLMMRQPDHPGLDMYFVVLEAAVTPSELLDGSGWAWSLVLDYVEVKSPAVPLLGSAGWAYSNVLANHATYTAMRSSWATYSALAVGP
jgi:hypothetical protein